MRKFLLLLVLGLFCTIAQAVPADNAPGKVRQPDGTTLTVCLHGDEFFNYLTTIDGYTVVQNKAGYYTYARLDGDRLVASDHIARDQRSASDNAYLAGVPKGLVSNAMVKRGTRLLNNRNNVLRGIGAGGHMDYSKFRGLIILINYTDKWFPMSDPNAFYNDMVNTHDFTGYKLPSGTNVPMTGSVRDYYFDNSFQQFDPAFDILGPVDVDYNCTYPHQMLNCDSVFFAALEALDGQVDFSQYDTDEDGTVDMVFFLVAGWGSDYSDNNRDYLWPHMNSFTESPVLDGVNFSLYACSTGMTGAEPEWGSGWSSIAGIGTFCHEFSHCLGLPDLYDTDYNGSGGTSKHPMLWSLMASGFKNNNGRNPVGYSLYERYALGFAQPTLIAGEDSVTLQALDVYNQGLRLNTANADEYFLIENRQAGKWDKNLPYHGMLIFRVDSTNVDVWENNKINCDPNHMYYQLLRANFNGMSDSPRDPFPGTSNVTSITSATDPSLRTWDGKMNQYCFTDIAEDADGIITFVVAKDHSKSSIEDFEKMPLGASLSEQGVEGVYAHWNFAGCAVVDTAQVVEGHVVAIKNGATLTTADNLNKIPRVVNYTVYNPTDESAIFTMYYSKNAGAKWFEADYPNSLLVPAGSMAKITVPTLPTDVPLMIQIKQTQGSSDDYCYLDNIIVYYENTWEPEFIPGDVDGNGQIEMDDLTKLINYLLTSDLTGIDPLGANVNGVGEIDMDDLTALVNKLLTE